MFFCVNVILYGGNGGLVVYGCCKYMNKIVVVMNLKGINRKLIVVFKKSVWYFAFSFSFF